MRFSLLRRLHHHQSPKLSTMATITTQVAAPPPPPTTAVEEENFDDILCSSGPTQLEERDEKVEEKGCLLGQPSGYLSGEARIERAWAHWKNLGRPKLIVAPMVDCSELPFRMLCRKYGAQAAYTPMLHSRIFTETEKYRSMEFTTCQVFFLSPNFFRVLGNGRMFQLILEIVSILVRFLLCIYGNQCY